MAVNTSIILASSLMHLSAVTFVNPSELLWSSPHHLSANHFFPRHLSHCTFCDLFCYWNSGSCWEGPSHCGSFGAGPSAVLLTSGPSPPAPPSPPILLALKELLAFAHQEQFYPHLGPSEISVSTRNRLIKNLLKIRTALSMKGLSSG